MRFLSWDMVQANEHVPRNWVRSSKPTYPHMSVVCTEYACVLYVRLTWPAWPPRLWSAKSTPPPTLRSACSAACSGRDTMTVMSYAAPLFLLEPVGHPVRGNLVWEHSDS